MQRTVIDYFKLRSNSLTVYPSFEMFPKKEKPDKQHKNTAEAVKFSGEMSSHTRKKVQSIVENWLLSIDTIMRERKQPRYKHYQYMTFVTLTLSAKQIHTDQEIKRLMLNRFLLIMKNDYKVKANLWVAEKQKNGNIHFHILIDRAIHWRKIRYEWNRIQSTHGYIDRFYQKYKHRDPNSTDIHALEKINNVQGYICKYITKKQEGKLVEGRLWGCSRNLTKLVSYGNVVDSYVIYTMEKAVSQGIVYKIVKNFATIYVGPCLKLLTKISRFHRVEARRHFRSLFDLITSRQKKRYSTPDPILASRPTQRANPQLRLCLS